MKRFVMLAVMALLTGAAGAQQALNLNSLKQDTRVFERILEERLKQSFSDPFAVAGDPQAAYLQGYGVVVSFHLNIHRATIRTPFGEVPVESKYGGPGARYQVQRRQEQLKKVKEVVIDCLAQYAGAIQQLGAHDRVSVSAHVEDRNELDPIRRKTVIVVSSTRDDVDLLQMRKITREVFQERLHILEY